MCTLGGALRFGVCVRIRVNKLYYYVSAADQAALMTDRTNRLPSAHHFALIVSETSEPELDGWLGAGVPCG